MDNKKIILSVSILVLLTLALIGGTYAWFSANVTNNADNKGVTVTTGKLGITYTDGNVINASDIMPGWTETKTFSVKNTGDSEATYKIMWSELENTFVNKWFLTYKIESTNGGGVLVNSALPSNAEDIITNIKVPAGVTQEYTITLNYENNGYQNSDQGKIFSGKIEVREDTSSVKEASGLAKELIDNYEAKGISKIEHTSVTSSQKHATTDYRYRGANSNNYITFNNEAWRIVGVFEVENASREREQRVKIVRNDAIRSLIWDTSAKEVNNGYGINAWEQSKLMKLLNPGYESEAAGGSLYWNRTSGIDYIGTENRTRAREVDFSTTGLTDEAKTLIEDAKWYLGGVVSDRSYTSFEGEYYKNKSSSFKTCVTTYATISSGCNDTLVRASTWVGKVGLLEPSDAYYTKLKDCNLLLDENWNEEDPAYVACMNDANNKSWLKNMTDAWTLNPTFTYNEADHINTINNAGNSSGSSRITQARQVFPSVYLKSSVKLVSGSGTEADPYQISL